MKLQNIFNEIINEADYNYHLTTKKGNQSFDKPYGGGTDSLLRMSGRSTGHFGSGTYFSTYKSENPEINKEYGEYSKYQSTPELIKIGDNIYRVDLDMYKNLYKVTSDKHGDFLFSTLKFINESFYSYIKDSKDISKNYMIIRNNLNELHLSIPSYREFLKLLNNYKEKYNKQEFAPTISTLIMEYNGYNGVNVSNVPFYDNTTHGSVIYDINKLSNEIKQVKTPSYSVDIKNDVIGSFKNVKSELLRNEKIYIFIDEINNLPKNEQQSYLKRYNAFIPSYFLNDLNEFPRKVYLKSLPNKLINNDIDLSDEKVTDRDIIYWIDNGLLNMIYNPKIIIDGMSFFEFALSYNIRLDDEIKEYLIKNINRPLSDREKIVVDEFMNS